MTDVTMLPFEGQGLYLHGLHSFDEGKASGVYAVVADAG